MLAEGAEWTAQTLSDALRGASRRFESRPVVLGHVQRGGTPTTFDRLLGTRLGAAAAEALAGGESGFVVGLVGGAVVRVPLERATAGGNKIDRAFYRVATALAQ